MKTKKLLVKPKILYIMSSYNIYGGTPKKTLDLMNHFQENSVIYVYHNAFPELKPQFQATGGVVYEGFYGRNIFLHLYKLLKIIDKEKINIVQTQFFWGEVLGFLIKLFRPNTKVLIAFVGSLKPTSLKSALAKKMYEKFDHFIYISKYVKTEKEKQFPIIKNIHGSIIYNGTAKRTVEENIIQLNKPFLLSVSSLIELKNIQIVIEALSILKKKNNLNDLNYYVAGEGKYKEKLEDLISKNNLNKNVFLIGNQTNIGYLLKECEIFLHPSYAEGFGIAVAEAMLAQKPIIVSNAGALPELIEHEKTGLVVNPYSKSEWANAILELIENNELANKLALNAKIKAEKHFSIKRYVSDYEKLYQLIRKD